MRELLHDQILYIVQVDLLKKIYLLKHDKHIEDFFYVLRTNGSGASRIYFRDEEPIKIYDIILKNDIFISINYIEELINKLTEHVPISNYETLEYTGDLIW